MEEVIFSVASVCLSVCQSVYALQAKTTGPTDLEHTLRIIISRMSSKVMVKGQGHQGQKMSKIQFSAQYQKRLSKIKTTGVKAHIIGQGQRSYGSRSKVVSQGHGVRSNLLGKLSTPSIRGRCDTRAFSRYVSLVSRDNFFGNNDYKSIHLCMLSQ